MQLLRAVLLVTMDGLEADPSVNTARNNTLIVAIVGYHGKSCLSGCYLDTDFA
jgi:hypothetical protein